MKLHNNKHMRSLFSILLLSVSVCLSSCGYERIGTSLPGSETGEFYSNNPQISQYETSSRNTLQKEFDDFCLAVFREEMEDADTLDLHYTLLHPETYQIKPPEVSLGSFHLKDMIYDNKKRRELQARLNKFDSAQLTDQQRIVFDALNETLSVSLMAEGLELYEQPLAPTIGIQAQLPILLAEYAFRSPSDIEDYLTLLSQMDSYYKEILDFEKQKADAGLAPSDTSIDAILASCESYLINPEQNFLTETFESRLDILEEQTNTKLTDEERQTLISRHITIIREHFIPAYQALIDGMSTLKGKGLNDGGLAGFADGRKYYEYLVKCGPGLSYSIPELKEALNARMEQDYNEIRELFAKHPSLADEIAGASFSLTEPTQILEDLKTKTTDQFPELPDCGYEVRYVPSHLEDSLSPAFYLTAPLDDTNQNVIYINHGASDSTDSLYTTLAHEGFPGHLYQTVYQRTHTSTPLLAILSCSGANEGWATYVENHVCTIDNGLSEAVGRYRALIRSFSLCVHGMLDIGINYDGWSKEEAANFISSCFQADEETIDALWQVMIDNPTNYLDYCGGYVEIMEMRAEAENHLGEAFSPMEFHKFLLDIGPVPFSVIRSQFEIWLNAQPT